MGRKYLNGLINIVMFLYILSIYIFTYRENLNIISNILALILIFMIWMEFLFNKRELIFSKFLFVYLLFIGVCSISTFYALDQSIAISKVKTLILIFLVMISLVNYIDTFEKLKKVITFFVYSGFVASIYILSNSDFSQITRFGNELGNVNSIGMIIGISVIFCFYLILSEKRYWYTIFLLIMIPTMMLTGSRKSLLFIVINIILVLYFKNRKSFKSMFKFILISVLLVVAIYYLLFNITIFYEILGKRIESLFSFITAEGTNEGSINMRAYMIKFGVEMFKGKPFMGYGIDNYRVLLGRNIGWATYSHNNYIELMVGTGAFGVIVYYLTHIVVIKDLLKSSKKNNDATLCYVFIAIIISYIILASSLVYYDEKHFSFLLAIATVMSRNTKPGKFNNFKKIGNNI